MNEMPTAIMDAAERRIRIGGFNGFSFREIAADVGVKSSSVHYHFPTKEDLAAAVIRRYTDDAAESVDQELAAGVNPVSAWILRFRRTLHSAEHMCPCAVLGAETRCLSPIVAVEVQRFFKMCHEKMVAAGLSMASADKLLAAITGALLVAAAIHDWDSYDRALSELPKELGFDEVKTANSKPTKKSALRSRISAS